MGPRCYQQAMHYVAETESIRIFGLDVTDRRRIEEQIQEANRELARSNQDLEQFAYVASHDLQEPLRMVTGYLQLLRERYQGHIDEKADKYIAYTVDGAERMSMLIRDLLAYSRTGRGGEALQEADAGKALDAALRTSPRRSSKAAPWCPTMRCRWFAPTGRSWCNFFRTWWATP